MKEISDMEKKAINRPVADLPRTAEKEVLDVITNHVSNDGKVPSIANGHTNGHTHADRVKEAIGGMFMDVMCSHCGSEKVIRAGACGVCTECGTSQGCS
jgi:ribonucleoside-diphosphate reductase alpha chain